MAVLLTLTCCLPHQLAQKAPQSLLQHLQLLRQRLLLQRRHQAVSWGMGDRRGGAQQEGREGAGKEGRRQGVRQEMRSNPRAA